MGSLNSLSLQEKKAILELKERVQKICGVSGWELRVFGSRARQEGNEESDVDVLVLLSQYDEPTKVKIWDEAYHIFADTDILVAPLVLSYQQYERWKGRERLLVQNVEKDGIPL